MTLTEVLRNMDPAQSAEWQRELDHVRQVSAQGPKLAHQSVGRILAEDIMQLVLALELLSIASYAMFK